MLYELIINPNAGNIPKGGILRLARQQFPQLRISSTKKRGDATSFAKNSKADVIIAAGGDGTVNEVINGILKRKKRIPLGILPVGTANMFAKYLQIPNEIEDAMVCIRKGYRRPTDVGIINGRCFMNAAGVGLDAQLFKNLQPALKKLFGQAAYTISGFQTVFKYKPQLLTIHAGKLKFRGYYVAITNVGTYGPLFNIAPQARIDDGKLDVLVFEKPQVFDALRYLMGIMTSGHRFYEDVTHIQTAHIRITSKSKVLFHADAELGGHTPVEVDIRKHAVEVICPDVANPRELLDKGVSALGKIMEKIIKESAKKVRRLQSRARP